MRSAKKFTPTLLERFMREQRGQGTRHQFGPWHQVTRGDPSSHGRSHLIPHGQRHLNLLSDEERSAILFALLHGGEDLLEQLPLSLHAAPHELTRYDIRYAETVFPGTTQLCEAAGVRHPRTYEQGRSALWIMTTDALLVMRFAGELTLLAISSKNKDKFTRRERELLAIERAYWEARGVKWLLITPSCYHGLVRECLECTWPWHVLREPVRLEEEFVGEVLRFSPGRALTRVYEWISTRASLSHEDAQCAFWQAVWARRIPLDLRRTWRSHIPVNLLTPAEFAELNPVHSRRSAWI